MERARYALQPCAHAHSGLGRTHHEGLAHQDRQVGRVIGVQNLRERCGGARVRVRQGLATQSARSSCADRAPTLSQPDVPTAHATRPPAQHLVSSSGDLLRPTAGLQARSRHPLCACRASEAGQRWWLCGCLCGCWRAVAVAQTPESPVTAPHLRSLRPLAPAGPPAPPGRAAAPRNSGAAPGCSSPRPVLPQLPARPQPAPYES